GGGARGRRLGRKPHGGRRRSDPRRPGAVGRRRPCPLRAPERGRPAAARGTLGGAPRGASALKSVRRANGKFVLRELDSPDEFHETVDVGRSAWRFSDLLLSPASDLIAGTHAGGLAAGAFEGGRMLGFVFGLPRTNQGKPCQHSHLLAVRREAQGRGLGVLLKLFQRRWCLEHGIQLVTWTYDPFLVKNARLNIGRLRATARAYLPNFYGDMGGIYGTLPTDRFEVVWRLDDPIVERAA